MSLYAWNSTKPAERFPDLVNGILSIRFDRMIEVESWDDMPRGRDVALLLRTGDNRVVSLIVPRCAVQIVTGFPE